MEKTKPVVAALTPAQVAEVTERMNAARDAGKEIYLAIGAANDAQVNVFQMILAAHLSGIMFEELEQVQPELKAQGAYRQAKSTIKAARAKGIDIQPEMSAGEMRKATKGPEAVKAEDEGDSVTTSTPGANAGTAKIGPFAEWSDVCKMAFARLAADAGLREEFVAQIHAVNKQAQGELALRLAATKTEKKAA